jgi:dTDP-4-amino-4,6-dideoxygalactose transaminase
MNISSTKMKVPITRPLFGEDEERALVSVLRSGWIVQGPKVAEFERLVASYVGAQEAIATSSCTTALHLALVLGGIGRGDEVIVPSFSFIATANAVCYTGATPVFVDIDPQTYNLDPERVGAAITPRTKAIMPVHQIGLAADMDRLNAVAHHRGLAVIEDAAPALGATYKGKRVGGLGNVTCLSFHPRKVITAGEGGMILTDDPAFADRARILRTHGMSLSDLQRHQATSVTIEAYHDLGYNYRLSDLHAAVGIAQMNKLEVMLKRRQAIAARYDRALAELDCLQLPFSSADQPHSYQSYLIQVRPHAPKTREQVMQQMFEAGIATRRGVMAIHLEPYYRQRFPQVTLPITEAAAQSTLLLPIYTTMTDREQDYVIDHLRSILHP